MFYEEKIINGVLCYRTSPDAVFLPSKSHYADAVNALLKLTDEERFNAIHYFCVHCGTKDTNCQCWNDD